MFIDIRTDDRTALAFLKWAESHWTSDELPTDVLHFFYAVEDSVVRR